MFIILVLGYRYATTCKGMGPLTCKTKFSRMGSERCSPRVLGPNVPLCWPMTSLHVSHFRHVLLLMWRRMGEKWRDILLVTCNYWQAGYTPTSFSQWSVRRRESVHRTRWGTSAVSAQRWGGNCASGPNISLLSFSLCVNVFTSPQVPKALIFLSCPGFPVCSPLLNQSFLFSCDCLPHFLFYSRLSLKFSHILFFFP